MVRPSHRGASGADRGRAVAVDSDSGRGKVGRQGMSAKKNKYGLTRPPPDNVKRLVRRRCGFGCVLCGNAIITYEHFDPPFKDAKSHNTEGITLLCGGHQIESMKGLLSKGRIAKADADPCCRRQGHAQSVFDLGGQQPPTLVLGTTKVRAIGDVLRINGSSVVQVHAPEARANVWRLSATFPAEDGKVLCRIVENELQVNSANVDVVQEARRFTILDRERSVVLGMELEPPSVLRIVKFRWSAGGVSLEIVDRCPTCSKIAETCAACSLSRPDERRGWLVVNGPTFGWTFEECGLYSSTMGFQVSENGMVLGGRDPG